MPPVYNLILNELQGAVRLLIRGAAHELIENHNVPQPEADILTLTAVFCEIDSLADLPTLVLSDVITAIRVSVENERTDALEEAKVSKTSCVTDECMTDCSTDDTTIDGHIGHLMTVEEFKEACYQGLFIDYDGMGDLVKDGKIVTKRNQDNHPQWITPSTRLTIPEDVTHILWYNK